VVRYTLAQPKDMVDWRRTSIFHTWIKIDEKIIKSLLILKVVGPKAHHSSFDDD